MESQKRTLQLDHSCSHWWIKHPMKFFAPIMRSFFLVPFSFTQRPFYLGSRALRRAVSYHPCPNVLLLATSLPTDKGRERIIQHVCITFSYKKLRRRKLQTLEFMVHRMVCPVQALPSSSLVHSREIVWFKNRIKSSASSSQTPKKCLR